MLTYIIRRLLLMIPTLIGVTMVVFFIMAYAPGGFQSALDEGSQGQGVEARRLKQELTNRYGLDQPTPVQYLRWLNQVSPVGFKMSGDKVWDERVEQSIQEQLQASAWVKTPRQAKTYADLALTIAAYSGLSPEEVVEKFNAAAADPEAHYAADDKAKANPSGPAHELFELIDAQPLGEAAFWAGIDNKWRSRAYEQQLLAWAQIMRQWNEEEPYTPADLSPLLMMFDADVLESYAKQVPYERERAVSDLFREVGFSSINKSRMRFGSIKLWDPDLGKDRSSRKVVDLLVERLPITLLMNLITIPLIYIVSIIIGVLAARRRGGFFDVASGVVMLALYSVPVILAGTLMIAYLASSKYLHWFPASGIHDLQADAMPLLPYFIEGELRRGWLVDFAWHMVLPITCLTYAGFAYLAKVLRGSVLETISADFIRTARAKGVSEQHILFRHVLRNSLLPLITMAAAILPGLFVGSFVVEYIFSIQGMGLLTIEAAKNKDINIMMATTLVGSLLSLFSLLVRDILYAAADPRVSYD